jgi:iron complex transport system substrate-binding protein
VRRATPISEQPRRIVSLSPSNTEILCALGLGRRLVGVDDWSNHPPAVGRLPKVGRDLEIDVEAVARLEPDLVVACLSVPGMEGNVTRVQAAGLPYIALAPTGLESIFANIRAIGEATGAARRAEALVAVIKERLATVRRALADVPDRPRVYWEWWPKPLVAAAGRSWVTEMIRIAGGENVFADRDAQSVRVESDEVLARRPEVVVACWCGARTAPKAARIAGRPGWEDAPAVRAGRVHVVPESLFTRPGPRLADGLALLASLLHPERALEAAS